MVPVWWCRPGVSVRTPLESECSLMGLGIWVANVGSTAIHRTQAYSVSRIKDLYLSISVSVCGSSSVTHKHVWQECETVITFTGKLNRHNETNTVQSLVVFCRELTKSRDVLRNRSLRMRNFLPSLAFLTFPLKETNNKREKTVNRRLDCKRCSARRTKQR